MPQYVDMKVLLKVFINKSSIHTQVQTIMDKNEVWGTEDTKYWLLKAVQMIDLTTLAGDDTQSNVFRLCMKAANPLSSKVIHKLKLSQNVRTAAVCVYPNRVSDAYTALSKLELNKVINVASVATGFPSGLYPLESRLQEIKFAISQGANEIDVVLDRSLVLMGKWDQLYLEVKEMKDACGNAHLKVILGVGELGTYENVYKASMVSMMAGADFIKTSTGKEAVNATLEVGLVMCRAIRKFYEMTGSKVGLKPAGGLKTPQDAINWLVLVHNELGEEWLTPQLFRFGASSLLDAMVKQLESY
ncbi:hypothetical protein K1T71_004553 [Dendrolimus kikuchii]|uniref:Uncharacterized protein n=1 Tax=Dendrolimus kikuchii TaxID=765133 RepID=A0ACC1D954_9NEOP|nr:hypothetical protein K1T71_004553 [Dendrolimus kikuchii]